MIIEPDKCVRFKGSVWTIPDLPPICSCGECEDASCIGDEFYVMLERTAVVLVWVPAGPCLGWISVGEANIDYSSVSLTAPESRVSSTT
jgi:hypothetical protein